MARYSVKVTRKKEGKGKGGVSGGDSKKSKAATKGYSVVQFVSWRYLLEKYSGMYIHCYYYSRVLMFLFFLFFQSFHIHGSVYFGLLNLSHVPPGKYALRSPLLSYTARMAYMLMIPLK